MLFKLTILGIVLMQFILVTAENVPLCPATSGDIVSLNPLTACVGFTVTATLSEEQAKAYFASNQDETCVQQKNSCASAIKFNKCQNITQDLIKYIVPESIQSSSLVQCSNVFKGLTEYCDRPFGELISLYCPDPPALSLPVIIGIVVGGLVMIVLTAFVCWRTKKSIQLDREIEAAVAPYAFAGREQANMNPLIQASGNPKMVLAPKRSKYHGVEWNFTANGWDALYKTSTVKEWLGTFDDEELAARKYDTRILQLQKKGAALNYPLNFPNDSPTPSTPSTSVSYSPDAGSVVGSLRVTQAPPTETKVENRGIPPPPGLFPQWRSATSSRRGGYDDPDRDRHIQELIQFYQYYDPERPDIEAHVLSLFEKYNFRGIARALLRKYSVLPSGWDQEYDATRSLAMSMAARLFSPAYHSGQVALPPSQSIAIKKDQVPDF
jgi:hypothetical protein